MPILTFPYTRQATSFSCGASATQAVLYYYGIEKREDELMKALGASKDSGVPVKHLIGYIQSCGLKVTAGRMTLQHLKSWIDQGVPVILLIQAWAEDKDCDYAEVQDEGHYAIAVGYDRHRILFEDPSLLANRGFMTFGELEDRWHDKGANQQTFDHFGIAVWGRDPSYDPLKVLHIAADRVASRWLRKIRPA